MRPITGANRNRLSDTGSSRVGSGRRMTVRILGPGIVFTAALALSMAVERSALFYHVDSWFADAINGITAPDIRLDGVLIVDLDEASMDALAPELGPWPYRREVFALVTEHLNALGARAIMFNLDFSDRRAGDARFAAVLARTSNVWMAAQGYGYETPDPVYEERLNALAWNAPDPVPARNWRGFRLPNHILIGPGQPRAAVAVVNFEPDVDGILRRVPLMHRSGKHYLPSLPLASLFESGVKPELRRNGASLQAGSRSWPVDGDGNVYLRVPSNADMFEDVSFHRVIRSAMDSTRPTLDRSLVKGRNVFIGSRAARLGEYAHLPGHGRMAGVDILALAHMNLSSNLVLAPRSKNWLVFFCLLGAVIPLLAVNLRPVSEWMVAATFASGAFLITIIHLVLLGYSGRQSALLFPLMLNSLTLLGQMVLRIRMLHQERHRYYLEKLAADEASALKSQFLSHMTHELRTPLSAIMGYNRLLSDPDIDDDERAARVDIIDKNCQHLLSLINNLLDQAKIEAGQMVLDIDDVPVASLIDRVIGTLRLVADEKGLEIQCNISERVPGGLRVDELRLRQILVNLGGNAVKFTAEGRVKIDLDWTEGRLKVEVSDTGAGMSREETARIFEAFQQANTSVARSHGGTGLGLSISQSLARLMGGEIRVNSRPGQGSTFTLEIPAEAVEYSDGRMGEAGRRTEQAVASGRVLVVDDTEDLRRLLSLYLKTLGVEVLLAGNGEEAVRTAVAENPELVFMDVQMPIMDGLQAVRALRHHGFSGKILALTAQSEPDQIEAARDAGCDGYIEKPVSRDRVCQIVKQHLRGGKDTPGKEANMRPNTGHEESLESTVTEKDCKEKGR